MGSVREYLSDTPDDLRAFDEADIQKAFDYLESEFHLSKEWRKEFKRQLNYMARGIPPRDFFFKFALKNLDSHLKALTMRKTSVIIAMCRYLIREKIKGKNKANMERGRR